MLASSLIRPQPAGGVIEPVLGRRASIEATSTSPLVVVAGRGTVRVDPNVLALVTAPAGGRALSARPAPETVMPRTSASPRNPRCRRSRASTDPIGVLPCASSALMSPPFPASCAGHHHVSELEEQVRLAFGPALRQLASGFWTLKAVFYKIGRLPPRELRPNSLLGAENSELRPAPCTSVPTAAACKTVVDGRGPRPDGPCTAWTDQPRAGAGRSATRRAGTEGSPRSRGAVLAAFAGRRRRASAPERAATRAAPALASTAAASPATPGAADSRAGRARLCGGGGRWRFPAKQRIAFDGSGARDSTRRADGDGQGRLGLADVQARASPSDTSRPGVERPGSRRSGRGRRGEARVEPADRFRPRGRSPDAQRPGAGRSRLPRPRDELSRRPAPSVHRLPLHDRQLRPARPSLDRRADLNRHRGLHLTLHNDHELRNFQQLAVGRQSVSRAAGR